MDIRNRRAIHARAAEVLSAAPSDPRMIALFYTAICAVMALVSSLLTGFLTDRIADTGGLSGMGLRSILSTGQTVLPIIQLVISVCLNLGYHFAVLRLTRGEVARPQTLLEGFRNFGPILRAVLFQSLLYLSYGIVAMYLAAFLFMATPFAKPFYTVMEPLMNSPSVLSGEVLVDEATLLAASEALMPMIWIWLGLFLLLFLPAYYGYRMTNFCIADNPRWGALRSLHMSKMMMRRNRIALFKLDLSMWWFYALQILISVICYGDMILPLLGISLPWSSTFSYYFFFVLSLVLQIVTYYFLMNRVYVAYALAYEGLQGPKEPEKPKEPNFPFPTEY